MKNIFKKSKTEELQIKKPTTQEVNIGDLFAVYVNGTGKNTPKYELPVKEVVEIIKSYSLNSHIVVLKEVTDSSSPIHDTGRKYYHRDYSLEKIEAVADVESILYGRGYIKISKEEAQKYVDFVNMYNRLQREGYKISRNNL